MAEPYPQTYQRETAPSWLRYAAVLNGVVAPELSDGFRYLELGCGQGLSTLLHAAANPGGDFVACDLDSDAIAFAQVRAKAFGIENTTFEQAGFEDVEGAFDFVVLHGVYSWVDAATRAVLRKVVHDRLKPGGLCYVSYNAMPGWADEIALQRLLRELHREGDLGGAVKSVDALKSFSFFTQHPAAQRAVTAWGNEPLGYLAQEYIGASEPLWSVDVIDEMAAAGMTHIGSATLRDAHDELLFDAETAKRVAEQSTERLRRLAADFALNRAFRRDLFVKGMPAPAGRDALDSSVIGCVGAAAQLPDAIVVPRGRIRFAPAFVPAVRHLFGRGPQVLRHAAVALGGSVAARRNLLWLVASGALTPFAAAAAEPLPPAMESAIRDAIARGEMPGWMPRRDVGGAVTSPA